MRLHRAGPLFWVWTFVVGVFSPGRGKRRINSRMREIRGDNRALLTKNSELTSENKFLRQELGRVVGENNHFLAQDEMNAVIHNSPFAPSNLPTGNDGENEAGAYDVNSPLAKAP